MTLAASITLLVLLIPAGAQAACIGPGTFDQLAFAFAVGGEVTVCADITAPENAGLTVGTTPVTLDLNGHTVNITDGERIQLAAIAVPVGHQLTIKSSVAGGALAVYGGIGAAAIGGSGGALSGPGQSAGTITIDGGTVNASTSETRQVILNPPYAGTQWGIGGGAAIGGGTGIGGGGNGGQVTVNGGTVTAAPGEGAGIGGGSGAYVGNGGNGGSLTVNGGTVTAGNGISTTAGVGGGLSDNGYVGGSGATVVVKGGTLNAYGYNSGSNAVTGPGIGGGPSSGPGTQPNPVYTGGAGGTLTVLGGEVHATGGHSNPGIGGGKTASVVHPNVGGRGATVVVQGGTVVAQGGDLGPGVGGGSSLWTGGDGGTVNVTEGSLTALGGTGAPGIGGGCGIQLNGFPPGAPGAGADVTTEQDGTIEVLGGEQAAGALGAGCYATPGPTAGFGSLDNAGTLILRDGTTEIASILSIPAGATAENSGTLELNGSLTGGGTLPNTGTIWVREHGSIDGGGDGVGGPLVSGNNFLVSYDPNGGTGATPIQRIYQESFASFDPGPKLPPGPTPPPGATFLGWFTAPTGGNQVLDSSPLATVLGGDGPRSATLYAHWEVPPPPPLSVRLIGLPKGVQFGGRPRLVRCESTGESAPCTVTRTAKTNRRSNLITTRVTYRASAVDGNGRTATARGSYRILGIYLGGSTWSRGHFRVRQGHRYRLVVTRTRHRPRLVTGGRAGHWRRAGRSVWTTSVRPSRSGRSKTGALTVRTGQIKHHIRLRFF